MDAQTLITIFNTVFENDPVLLENSLTRLKLQGELVQINSKIAVAQELEQRQNDLANQALTVLVQERNAKQAEIDALEE